MTINTDTPAYIVDGVLTDGEAWVALGTTTVSGTSTDEVNFESSTGANDWSQYMNLFLISYSNSEDAYLRIQLNDDTTSNYIVQQWDGAPSPESASSYYATSNAVLGQSIIPTESTDIMTAGITTIYNINSGAHKTIRSDIRTANTDVSMYGVRWQNQAPVTKVTFMMTTAGNFEAGSRFDVFGILPRMVTA